MSREPDDVPVDDEDDPAAKGHALGVLGVGIWLALLVVVAAGGVLFLVKLGQAKDPLFECAAAAIASTVFIGLYVLARCVEKIAAGMDRISRQ